MVWGLASLSRRHGQSDQSRPAGGSPCCTLSPSFTGGVGGHKWRLVCLVVSPGCSCDHSRIHEFTNTRPSKRPPRMHAVRMHVFMLSSQQTLAHRTDHVRPHPPAAAAPRCREDRVRVTPVAPPLVGMGVTSTQQSWLRVGAWDATCDGAVRPLRARSRHRRSESPAVASGQG